MDFIPNICGDDNIYIPQEGCDECDRFEQRLEVVEQTTENHEERIVTLEECCDEAKTELANHEDTIERHEATIESIENRFSDFYTKPETYSQQQVDELLGQVETSSYVEVDELPETGEPQTIYLVRNGQGSYEQWIWSNNSWVDLGGTSVDMSDYVTVDDVIDMIHPIGDTVIRLDDIDPADLYTGTVWQLVSQGRMIIGANATYPLGSYGGEASHVLTQAEMPSHTHVQDAHSHYRMRNGREFVTTSVSTTISRHTIASGSGAPNMVRATNAFYSDQYVGDTVATNQYTGGGAAHNNMPPYLAVNIWVRTE